MSHLGDRLSALVDGELGGAERDKAYAHLARCEQCRTEAAALRDLKRQLRALAADRPEVAAAEADVMRRLMTMTGVGIQQPQRRLRVPRPGLSRPSRGLRPPGPGGNQPGGTQRPQIRRFSRRHRRYLAVGAVTVMVGLGTAAFTVGGGDPAPGPKITPQMQLYSEEHAITTGEVPFAGVPGSVEGGMGPASNLGMSSSAVLPATVPSGGTAPTALDSGRPAQKP